MYEEGKKIDINWSSLLIKLAIFAFILLIAGFIFFKIVNSKNTTNNKTKLAMDSDAFTTNINNMKSVAFEYFTKSRLPEKTGSTEKLTLKEMIDEKLIIDFTNNGEYCNLEDSYIQATRTLNDNYALRIDLTCGKKSDYIVSTIEKEEICKNNTCPEEEVEIPKEEVVIPEVKEDTTTNNSSSSNSSTSTYYSQESSSSNSNSSSSSNSNSNKKQTVTTTTTTTITYKIKCINGCCCCCNTCEK